MKENQEPANKNEVDRSQQSEPASTEKSVVQNITAAAAERLAAVPSVIGNQLSAARKKIKQGAANRAAQVRARLENQLPDAPEAKIKDAAAKDAVTLEFTDKSRQGSGTDKPASKSAAGEISLKDSLEVDALSDDTRPQPLILPAESENTAAFGNRNTANVALPGTLKSNTSEKSSGDLDNDPDHDLTNNMQKTSLNLEKATSAVGTSVMSLWTSIKHAFRAYRKRRANDRSIRRDSRERVYRLKGYTTVAKVNRRFASERRQRILRRILTVIIAILTLILLFKLYNPFTDLDEWSRIFGIDSLGKTTTARATTSSGSKPAASGNITITPAANR